MPVNSDDHTPQPHAPDTRKRGRPRDPRVHDAILNAARELLHEAGPAAVTMEAVAQRAGVGKATVYRWWPNRHAVAMAALMDTAPAQDRSRGRPSDRLPARPPDRPHSPSRHAAPRRPLDDLENQLLVVADTLASRTGRHVTAMIAAADPNTEVAKAFRHHFVLARRSEGRLMLEQAMRRGELSADLQIEVALDQIYGALFFRLLLGHATVDAAFVRALVAQALAGLQAPQD